MKTTKNSLFFFIISVNEKVFFIGHDFFLDRRNGGCRARPPPHIKVRILSTPTCTRESSPPLSSVTSSIFSPPSSPPPRFRFISRWIALKRASVSHRARRCDDVLSPLSSAQPTPTCPRHINLTHHVSIDSTPTHHYSNAHSLCSAHPSVETRRYYWPP